MQRPWAIRWRPSPRWLLVLVAAATLVIWWCVSPLARGRVYLGLGQPDWALEAAMQAPRTRKRVELLVDIMDAPGEGGATFWEGLTIEECRERGPWWRWWARGGRPAARLAAEWAETMRRPPSPGREATLQRLWQTPLAAGPDLPDSPFAPWVGPFLWSQEDAWWEGKVALQIGPSYYLADLSEEWLEQDPPPPAWIEHGLDGPLIEAVLPEWWATEESMKARVQLARRLLSTPTLRHTHLWNSLVRQDLIADGVASEVLSMVWKTLCAEAPSVERDAALSGLLQAEEKRNESISTWTRWLAAEVQREPPPEHLPGWVHFGPNGLMVEGFLEQIEAWPLRTCGTWQPDGLEGLLDAGHREIMAWLARQERGLTMSLSPFGCPLPGYPGGSRCAAAVLEATLARLETRGGAPLADLYLIAGLAAIELAHPWSAPNEVRWLERARLVRYGHTPSLDWRDAVRCVVCGEGGPPPETAAGIAEWSRPGARCREELAEQVRELEQWSWGACAGHSPATLQPPLELELAQEWGMRPVYASHSGPQGPGGIIVASVVRARLREVLRDRQDLSGGLPEILARAAGLVAASAAGHLPEGHVSSWSVEALRLGHLPIRPPRPLLPTTCAICGYGIREQIPGPDD